MAVNGGAVAPSYHQCSETGEWSRGVERMITDVILQQSKDMVR